jgi:hypothetical protein
MGNYPVEGFLGWVKDEDQIDTFETCREKVGHGDQPRIEIWCRFDVRLIDSFVFLPPLEFIIDKQRAVPSIGTFLESVSSWPRTIFLPSAINSFKSG